MSPTSYRTALPRDIILVVPETGIEPAREESHGILSPGRLPIPPLRQAVSLEHLYRIARTPLDVKSKIKYFLQFFETVLNKPKEE